MLKSKSLPLFMAKHPDVCVKCGCRCSSCCLSNSLDLHHEIEDLRSKLHESHNKLAQADRDRQTAQDTVGQQIDRLQDELNKLRDRYDRLLETYKQTQRNNHDLEEKILCVVEKFSTEKLTLEKEVSTLNDKLLESRFALGDMEEECERYRSDCTVAVQLLQCKPSNFVSHKLTALPLDLQLRVRNHLGRDQLCLSLDDIDPASHSDKSTIRVPMATFPPTAMFYSVSRPDATVDKASVDSVPIDTIARVLEPSGVCRRPQRLLICSACQRDVVLADEGTQTTLTDPNVHPRKAVANFKTNPPTISTQPGVHQTHSPSSSGSDSSSY